MKRAPLFFAIAILAGCPAPQSSGPTTPTPGTGGDQVTPPGPAFEAPAPPAVRLGTAVVPESYGAHLWLDPNKEDFRGEISIDVEVKEPTRVVWLNAAKLEVQSVTWATATSGAPNVASVLPTSNEDFLGIDLGAISAPGRYRLALKYTGLTNHTDYAGIFVQEEEGHKYLYTQFEALGARRAFPSFDQPEFKTPWKLVITAPQGQRAFANTPELKGETAGADITFNFGESKPLPSYLVAFAVGPFSIVDLGTGGREKTPLRVIVPKGREGQADYAKEHMSTILSALEDYFDLPYPYAKLDSIALPTFFGAMENPGLITYSADLLLVKPDKITQQFKERHTNVVAHEIAHQWFGNLVTLRWWNDIWLNESFASWLAGKTVHKLHPEWGGEVKLVEVRDGSMGSDVLETARRIRQEIKSKQDISAAFDGITYGKGAAVIAMFEQWIGEDKLRTAMREYMRTHAWKTTTSTDFLKSLAAASDASLAPAFSTFLDQTGVPVFTAKLNCEGKSRSLDLEQRRYVPTGSKAKADAQLWQVPVCVKYGAKGKTYSQCQLVTEKQAQIKVDKAGICPSWVLANENSAGYFRVSYQGDLLKRLLKASKKLSTAERIGLIGDVSALLGAGEIEIGAALALVPVFLRDKNPRIIESGAAIAAGVEPLVPKKLRANYERFLGKLFARRARALGWRHKPGDSLEKKGLRSSLVPLMANQGFDRVLLKRAKRMTNKWFKDRKAIDREMLGSTLKAAAKTGNAALYGKLYAESMATKDSSEKRALISALGAFSQPKLTERSLKLMSESDFDLRSLFGVLQTVLADPKRRQRGYDYVKTNFDSIAGKMPPMARGYLAFIAVAFCDEEHKKDAEEFFGKKLGSAQQSVAQMSEAIDLCVAQRKQQTPGLVKFLRKY